MRPQACGASGRLVDVGFDFMKSELTVNDAQQIATKIKTQPYTPPSVDVEGGDVFPSNVDMCEEGVPPEDEATVDAEPEPAA